MATRVLNNSRVGKIIARNYIGEQVTVEYSTGKKFTRVFLGFWSEKGILLDIPVDEPAYEFPFVVAFTTRPVLSLTPSKVTYHSFEKIEVIA